MYMYIYMNIDLQHISKHRFTTYIQRNLIESICPPNQNIHAHTHARTHSESVWVRACVPIKNLIESICAPNGRTSQWEDTHFRCVCVRACVGVCMYVSVCVCVCVCVYGGGGGGVGGVGVDVCVCVNLMLCVSVV